MEGEILVIIEGHEYVVNINFYLLCFAANISVKKSVLYRLPIFSFFLIRTTNFTNSYLT